MRPAGVVEGEIARESRGRCGDGVVGVQVDLFVFDRAPEAFDKDVVAPAALAIHADADPVLLEEPGEGRAGKLRPWSVLKISGHPYFAIASSTAAMQKALSSVTDTRELSTRRLAQSITTVR